jgi:hypothetical protein
LEEGGGGYADVPYDLAGCAGGGAGAGDDEYDELEYPPRLIPAI